MNEQRPFSNDEWDEFDIMLRDANIIFDNVYRELTILRFLWSIEVMDFTNLVARYIPRYLNDHVFHLEAYNTVASHAGYITHQVRKEAAAFEEWKREVEQDEASEVSKQQPSCLWNRILLEITYHARDILGRNNCPDPFSFEGIMRILDHSHARHCDIFQSGFFQGIDEFDDNDDLCVAETLVEDVWTIVVRYENYYKASEKVQDLAMVVMNAIGKRYCRLNVSVSGKLRAVWKRDGTENGIRVDADDQQDDPMRNGVPLVELVNGELVRKDPEPDTFDDVQWDVDVGIVRDVAVLDWEGSRPLPPPYEAGPPSYEDISNVPP
ncbi:hypothetical protein G7Z17_g8505 [Cylindrodendrum hubeiense]|uniref:Uncharacterized protein n=1 Tax=Cylindrodendrum hubeiense TaxID=595255 RepID=A0A9P5H9I6_9HYPO|nr:hypothetical protein G7Z17_g8505 [Cylindrodendrum hubeiense]